MSSVAADKLPPAEKEQLAVSYAAFILNGAGAEVTSDSLNAVLKAANLTANNTLINAVAKALKGKSVTDFFGSGDAPAPAAETKPVGKPADKPADKPKGKTEAPPPPPPPAEEEDIDMGGMFD